MFPFRCNPCRPLCQQILSDLNEHLVLLKKLRKIRHPNVCRLSIQKCVRSSETLWQRRCMVPGCCTRGWWLLRLSFLLSGRPINVNGFSPCMGSMYVLCRYFEFEISSATCALYKWVTMFFGRLTSVSSSIGLHSFATICQIFLQFFSRDREAICTMSIIVQLEVLQKLHCTIQVCVRIPCFTPKVFWQCKLLNENKILQQSAWFCLDTNQNHCRQDVICRR
mmetsp:Transcript_205/g.411  ORF Transcript_205/g.411 Transcript_205/m.411 type:complete len:222 (+) Transcript_205:283-948(+)